MPRVLVTDAEQRSSLAVIRSLGRAGVHVEACSSDRAPLGGASRHCRALHTCPDVTASPRAFLEALEAIVDERGIDVVIPMTDASAPTTLGLRETRPGVAIPFPAVETYHAVSDKRLLMEAASGLGVPVPPQTVVEARAGGFDEALSWCAGQGFPVVLKPARSAAEGEQRIEKVGVRIVHDADTARAALEAYPAAAYPVLVQARIRGPGKGVFALADGGEIVALFGHRRLREMPPDGGVSVLRESVPVDEAIGRHAERLLSHFGWTGVAMVEFKEDEASGTPYLMEINGRFWGSLQLAIDAGVDFPVALVRMATGERVTPIRAFREGVRSRWLWGDVDHLLWILRRPALIRADPTLPSRTRALGRFLAGWSPRNRLEVLRLSDPRPFVRESVRWFQNLRG